MQIDILCSGSKGNCTLIRSGSTCVMLDCGPSALRTIRQGMEQVHCRMEDLQAVLITHTHSDHIRQLRHFSWLPVYAYCPLQIRDPKKQPVKLSVHHVMPMIPFRIGCLLITPVALSHDAGPTCGFIIQDAYEKLVYVTDTGYVHNDLLPALRDADYYVMESNHDVGMLMATRRPMALKQRILSDTGHLNNQDSARILARLITPRTRDVVLAHLSEEANTPDLAIEAFTETMKQYQVCTDHLQLHCAAQYSCLQIGSLESRAAEGISAGQQDNRSHFSDADAKQNGVNPEAETAVTNKDKPEDTGDGLQLWEDALMLNSELFS